MAISPPPHHSDYQERDVSLVTDLLANDQLAGVMGDNAGNKVMETNQCSGGTWGLNHTYLDLISPVFRQ